MNDFDLEKTLNSNMVEIPMEFLEIGIDSIIKDGLLKDIPIFNTLTCFIKVGLNIRDRFFIKKLIAFLYETQSIPISVRQKVINDINNSSKIQTKIGEKLLYIIDRADEVFKARLIGQLFSLVLNEKIGYHMFLRCTESINRIFISDLEEFLSGSHYDFFDFLIKDNLQNAGILSIVSANGTATFGDSSFDLKYDVSDVGRCLRKHLGSSDNRDYSSYAQWDFKDKNKW